MLIKCFVQFYGGIKKIKGGMYGKNKIVWEIIGNRRKRMKKVRRIIILLLSFCLMMTMAGCSNEKKLKKNMTIKNL